MSHHSVRDLKHRGRRAFLALAGGGLLGLPLLEFTHGKAWAAGSTARRFLTVFEHGGTLVNQGYGSTFYDGGLFDGSGFHHGVDYWKPASPGETLDELGPIMQDLEAVKSKLLVLRGIDNMAAGAQCAYNLGGHGVSNNTALTAAMCEHPDPEDYDATNALGPSIDYVMADRLAEQYPAKFKRIHLTVDGHQYGTPYYAGPNQRAYGEASPQAAFATIFEGVSADEPDPAFLHAQAKRVSIMKGVMNGYNRYKGVVSQSDMHQIDAHLEYLSELEKELKAAPVLCQPPTGIEDPGGMPGDVVGSLHVKLILAALRCGLTNVANLEIADILAPWAPSGLLMDSGFDIGHSLHHYASDIGATGSVHSQLDNFVQEMLENRRWRMGLFKELAEGLDDPAFMEGENTMLDNSLMLMTSEFSSGAMHSSAGIPMLLAGSAGGYFKTGRHLNYNTYAATETTSFEYGSNKSTHNVFTSVLHAFGGDDETFGSGAEHAKHVGPLPDLT